MTQQPWGQPPSGWGRPAVQQPPSHGYPPPLGSYPPPRRGGSSLRLVLLGIGAAVALGFFAFSLTSYLVGGEQAGPTPLPTPEIGETSAPPTGVPDPDLDPPDIPVPSSWDEVDDWMLNNAVYAESTTVPTNCTLSRIDVTTTSVAELQEHLNTLTGCLMMVWQEPMQRAGFLMPRPPITVYTTGITTACGEMEGVNASYCGGDQRMYYSYELHTVFERFDPQVIDNAFLPDLVMGHEFGHAIQGRSGILVAEILAEQRAKDDESAQLELSRRTELQADCLAGIFLNSVAQASNMTQADRAGILEMAKALGDDSLTGRPGIEGNHGHGVHREFWTQTGLATNQVAACNTFPAPPEQVT